MEIKFIELRDRMTFIPAIAIKISGKDGWLSRAAGYGENACVLFGRLQGGDLSYDPYHWGDRTFHQAHLFLKENWDTVEDGDMVDVEFILKEKPHPAISEIPF